MRFDDRIATVLRSDLPQGGAKAAQFRQLIDLLAQPGHTLDPAQASAALTRVHRLREEVSDEERLTAVRALAGRLQSPALTQYLASDKPAIASAAINAARLHDEEWAALIPALSTRCRGFLRHRKDLGPKATRALHAYGSADFVLPPGRDDLILDSPLDEAAAEGAALFDFAPEPAEPADDPDDGEDNFDRPVEGRDIGEIVRRIEAFRKSRLGDEESPQLPLDIPEMSAPAGRIVFRTDAHGRIDHVEGAPRGALIGLSIAEAAIASRDGNALGIDAGGAAAFRDRQPLNSAHLAIAAGPDAARRYLCDARPQFDEPSGRFTGYHGVLSLAPEPASEGAPDRPIDQDSVRQLIHELRTPLNAAIGFAEIIEQRLFGPVSAEYREMARRIIEDARYLLGGIDDLDIALKLERGDIGREPGETSSQWLAERLAARLEPLAQRNTARLTIESAADLPDFAIARHTAERLVLRLAAAMTALCASGETMRIAIRAGATPGQGEIRIARPRALAGLSQGELLDADADTLGEGEGAPLLGVGFALRLARHLAAAQSGRLEIGPNDLTLTLKLADHNAEEALAGTSDT